MNLHFSADLDFLEGWEEEYLRALLRRCSIPSSDWPDVAQEVLTKLFLRHRKPLPAPGFSKYQKMRTIKNVVLNVIRHERLYQKMVRRYGEERSQVEGIYTQQK